MATTLINPLQPLAMKTNKEELFILLAVFYDSEHQYLQAEHYYLLSLLEGEPTQVATMLIAWLFCFD